MGQNPVDDRPPADVPYPPAPWRLMGQTWIGIFQTDRPVPVPDALKRLLPPHWAIVILARYLEGTLRYDELSFGTLGRRGLRIGLWVDRMWVDSVESLWGGRRIWGLPKDMATFAWSGNQVHVTDHKGTIATLTVDLTGSRLPAIWSPAPGLGRLPGEWTYIFAQVWAHPGRSSLRIDEWSPRFPYQITKGRPTITFAAKPFRMTVPRPQIIGERIREPGGS
jgi:Acetoacetate decarboxylase (ADC)